MNISVVSIAASNDTKPYRQMVDGALMKENIGCVYPHSSEQRDSLAQCLILQGNFTSNADREEFKITIASHGEEFLRIADAALRRSSLKGKRWREGLVRAVNKFKPHKSSKRATHEI